MAQFKNELRPILEVWEEAPELLPQYVIHQLSHKYTQNSLLLNALKGKDFMQVECLRQTALETGTTVLLATLELETTMDDEGEEEMDQNLHLQHILQLDGTKVCSKFKANEDNILGDDRLGELGTADETYKEPFTGNCGATETFWYRETVSRKITRTAMCL